MMSDTAISAGEALDSPTGNELQIMLTGLRAAEQRVPILPAPPGAAGAGSTAAAPIVWVDDESAQSRAIEKSRQAKKVVADFD